MARILREAMAYMCGRNDEVQPPQQEDMFYDTDRTLRGIHGTFDALKASMSEIEDKARYRTLKHHSALRLRFLTPLDPQPEGAGNVVHLRLTPLTEHTTDSKYVAVSYTWSQLAELESRFKHLIPTYRIWTTANESRPPNCPVLVLHRALMFAREKEISYGDDKLDRPLLWIDQECIRQDDSTDVESHLQVMHEIYQRSAFTGVVLSTLLDRTSLVDGIFPMKSQVKSIFEYLTEESPCYWKDCLATMEHLARDSWFTRTWCYQERYCAGRCFFLIPVDPGLPFGDYMAFKLSIPEGRLSDFYMHAEQLSANGFFGHLQQDVKSSILNLAQLIKDRFEASNSNTYQRMSAALTDDRLPRFYGDVFRGMEKCSNCIVSDRVAIFANICRFSWTLQSTLLRNGDISYSTCILMLLQMNTRGRVAYLFEDESLKLAMDLNIGDFLRVYAAVHIVERELEGDTIRGRADEDMQALQRSLMLASASMTDDFEMNSMYSWEELLR